jgi:riboflavin kinase/FMN adenylyltransferase
MLGRPYSISGTVAHGDELGRTIGFPTANIPLSYRDVPVQGVFAVEVVVDGVVADGARRLSGVANVGTRPTVEGDEMRLEVHLLDFERDIYGQHLDVEFLTRLRGEMKFSGLDALKDQIYRDIENAENYFFRARNKPANEDE